MKHQTRNHKYEEVMEFGASRKGGRNIVFILHLDLFSANVLVLTRRLVHTDHPPTCLTHPAGYKGYLSA